jgi:Tat protein translocase TatC
MTELPGAIADARIVGEQFVHSQRQQNPEGRMPLLDHIRELRNRVAKMALALAAGMIAGFGFFNQAWHVIERPLCATTVRGHSGCHTPGINELVLNGPLDPFYLRVKVALIVAVTLSSPIWLYQIWAFAAPGLYAREKRWSCIFLGAAVPLFGIGITLCYLSLGRSLRYLLGMTPGGVLDVIQVDQYMSFVMAMMLAFGRVRAAAAPRHAEPDRDPDPRAVPEVATGPDLRGVPDRGHGQPEPGPAHDADPRRSLRVAG